MQILVTGGGGFLGTAIVKMLLAEGHTVRSISRSHYAHLDELAVEQIAGDLGDEAAVMKAVEGCEQVFHVAAKAGVWGSYESYHQANVVGTENVISACRKHKVSKLIYTSSPSVVFDGEDQKGIDESVPYPEVFLAHYPKTKAMAESLVNQANSPELATVSLRPHLIWGPDDNHLVPRIVARGRARRIKAIGDPTNLVDTVYVDNAAEAHLQAAKALTHDGPCGGKNYFITNDEPMTMTDIINGILDAAGVAPISGKVSMGLAYGVGTIMESAYRLFGISSEPAMTRFVARQLGTAHWFDISAAKRDFGYQPKITIAEGLKRLKHAIESGYKV